MRKIGEKFLGWREEVGNRNYILNTLWPSKTFWASRHQVWSRFSHLFLIAFLIALRLYQGTVLLRTWTAGEIDRANWPKKTNAVSLEELQSSQTIHSSSCVDAQNAICKRTNYERQLDHTFSLERGGTCEDSLVAKAFAHRSYVPSFKPHPPPKLNCHLKRGESLAPCSSRKKNQEEFFVVRVDRQTSHQLPGVLSKRAY